MKAQSRGRFQGQKPTSRGICLMNNGAKINPWRDQRLRGGKVTIITRGFCPLITSKGLNLELGIKVDETTLNTASSLAKKQRVPMGGRRPDTRER